MNMPVEQWKILPYIGVGPLTFGLTRDSARILLGEDVSVFKKGPCATALTDTYESLGIHLYYDNDERLECIEFVKPAPVRLRDITLLNVPIKETLAKLVREGIDYRYADGYFIDEYGIALYAPLDEIEAVTVFKRDYYNIPLQ